MIKYIESPSYTFNPQLPWSFSFTYEGIVREKFKNRKMKKENLFHTTYVDQKHRFVQSSEINFSINFFWMV
jgi:hypothetical protein